MGKRALTFHTGITALISITDLSFAYQDQRVLENINLDYQLPEFLGIIGENGGGKSTLIKLILGLIDSPPCILKKLPLSKIGYVPQHLFCNPNFPICVFDLVLMGRTKPFGLYGKKDKEKAKEALEMLKISHLSSYRFDLLSGGQKQKVLLARALCSDCELLILDEPTASIDTQARNEIFELLTQLNRTGIGIIAISHDLDLLLAHATQIAYLKKTLQLFKMPQEKGELLKYFGCKHHLGLSNA